MEGGGGEVDKNDDGGMSPGPTQHGPVLQHQLRGLRSVREQDRGQSGERWRSINVRAPKPASARRGPSPTRATSSWPLPVTAE